MKPAFRLLAAITIAGLTAIVTARSEAAEIMTVGSQPLQTAFLQQLPSNAKGIVLVENLREASLLQLRGAVGKGIAMLRDTDGAFCVKIPLRFIAGDFGGTGIQIRRTGPVFLVIYSKEITDRLTSGQDIVSDMFSIGAGRNRSDVDINIRNGLSDQAGFVLNPGRTFLADLFGTTINRDDC